MVLPVRAWELALAIHNFGGHRRTAAVRIAWVKHDAGIVHFIPPLAFLHSHERHLVATLQAPCVHKVRVGAARRVDIRLVSAFRIDAHRHLGQMSHRDDGCKGTPFVALQRHELVELAQALARVLQRCRTLAQVLQVHLLELVHTVAAIAHTLEGMVADVLEHTVEQCHDFHQDALQSLCSGLRVLHMTV